jgi:hypothetical protein
VDRWLSCSTISGAIAREIDTDDATPLVLGACVQASRNLSGLLTEMIADLDRNGRFALQGTATVSADGGTLSHGTWQGVYQLSEAAKARLGPGSADFTGRELLALP